MPHQVITSGNAFCIRIHTFVFLLFLLGLSSSVFVFRVVIGCALERVKRVALLLFRFLLSLESDDTLDPREDTESDLALLPVEEVLDLLEPGVDGGVAKSFFTLAAPFLIFGALSGLSFKVPNILSRSARIPPALPILTSCSKAWGTENA